jgi:type IV fimbrial biogenesis protein FimT
MMNNPYPNCRCVAHPSVWHCRQTGFSLYDLIITSAVVGVLGVGAVSMAELLQATRTTNIVNQLMGNLSLARSEAIKRATPITICPGTTSGECQAIRDWKNGWVMFSDPNGNGVLGPNESILRIEQATNLSTIKFSAWGPGTGRWVTFEADGSTKQNGTFTFCDERGATKAKAVILLGTGRARVSSVNSSGGSLSCS